MCPPTYIHVLPGYACPALRFSISRLGRVIWELFGTLWSNCLGPGDRAVPVRAAVICPGRPINTGVKFLAWAEDRRLCPTSWGHREPPPGRCMGWSVADPECPDLPLS